MAERRIPARDFWEISDLMEAAQEAAKDWDKWRKAYVKAKGHFLDEVNFLTGAIMERGPDGAVKVIGHMDQEDLDKAWEITASLTEMDNGIQKKLRGLAARFGIFPQDIDIKTGTVKEADFETIKEPEEKATGKEKPDGDEG